MKPSLDAWVAKLITVVDKLITVLGRFDTFKGGV